MATSAKGGHKVLERTAFSVVVRNTEGNPTLSTWGLWQWGQWCEVNEATLSTDPVTDDERAWMSR